MNMEKLTNARLRKDGTIELIGTVDLGGVKMETVEFVYENDANYAETLNRYFNK
jgi:hypothetical protein